MEFFYRFRNPLVLVAFVLAQVLALALQVQRPLGGNHSFSSAGISGSSPDGESVTLLRRWTAALVTPVARLAHGTSLHTRHLWWNYIDLRHARDQTQDLQAEVRRLREEQAAFAEDAAQGRRLQSILAFKQQYISGTVAAQVIGASGSDRSHVLLLDKGWADGLRPEQPVVTPDGVVGKLRDVFPHSAQLLLLSDSTSGAGVILVSTRLRAILRGGNDGEVQITNLTPDDRIKPGETVITSGGDQIFPRGLPIGVITAIRPDPQHQPYTAITVKPAANLQQLEEVLVITGTSSTLPAVAQADATQAEALAVENKRAADLIAERLPSLHERPGETGGADSPSDGKSADGKSVDAKTADAQTTDTKTVPDDDQTGGVPGVPSSGVPRVKPTLHADHYTPGATPSAAELMPGAPAASNAPVPANEAEPAIPAKKHTTARAPAAKAQEAEPDGLAGATANPARRKPSPTAAKPPETPQAPPGQG